jgi:hypothetical protein
MYYIIVVSVAELKIYKISENMVTILYASHMIVGFTIADILSYS